MLTFSRRCVTPPRHTHTNTYAPIADTRTLWRSIARSTRQKSCIPRMMAVYIAVCVCTHSVVDNARRRRHPPPSPIQHPARNATHIMCSPSMCWRAFSAYLTRSKSASGFACVDLACGMPTKEQRVLYCEESQSHPGGIRNKKKLRSAPGLNTNENGRRKLDPSGSTKRLQHFRLKIESQEWIASALSRPSSS